MKTLGTLSYGRLVAAFVVFTAVLVGVVAVSRSTERGDETPSTVPAGVRCHECGMNCSVDSRFTAQAKTSENTYFFCDIGDLLHAFPGLSGSPAVFVRDYPSGAWIRAEQAWYVENPTAFKTPMSWAIAAFKDRGSAAAYGPPKGFRDALKIAR